MNTFEESQHARDNAGKFTEMSGSEQEDQLIGAEAGAVEPDPSSDPTGLRQGYRARRIPINADLEHAIEVMESAGLDWSVYQPNPEQIAQMIADGMVKERWRDTPERGDLNEYQLKDVITMGGDEIRAMTTRQRQFMHSEALHAAARLKDYLDELGESPSPTVGDLEVIDRSAEAQRALDAL